MNGVVALDGVKFFLDRCPGKFELARGYRMTGIPFVGIRLCQIDIEKLVKRQIEAVEPDHRLRTLVAVVVPVPCWGQYDIFAFHGDFLAFDSGEAVRAFDDEAKGEGHVSMCRSHFTRENKLQARIDGVGGARSGQRRIHEHEDAALGLFSADDIASLEEGWAHLFVPP